MAKFATNVSGAILLPSSIQVTESFSGSVVPLAMFTLNGLNGLLTEGFAVLHYIQCCTSRSFMSSVKRGNVDPNMLAGPES